MPIAYLALANNGKPLPAFSQKKIGNRMPGPAGEVPISVIAGFVFFPVMAFRFLIAAFASKRSIESSDGFFYNAFKSISVLNRLFDVPVASIRFGELQKEQIETLKGMALQSDLTNQNIFVGSPSLQHLSQINALRPVDDRIRPGHVSFDGYLAWTYLIKGIHILSTVMTTMNTNSYSQLFAAEYGVAAGTTGKVLSTDNKVIKEYVNTSESAVAPNQGRLLFVAPVDDWSSFNGSFIDATTFGTSLHGIFFPFFLGMSVPDKTIAFQVFSSIFAGSIASSAAATASLLQRIRSGIRQLAFSRSGMVMAHAYTCIGLALQVPNSRFHVVLKGNVYCGVVIEGKFAVSLYGITTESGDVNEDIKSINLLESQAGRIVELLNAVEDGEKSAVYKFTKDDFMTSRKALQNWNSIDRSLFHSSDTLKAVETVLSEMEFNDTFTTPSVKMVDHFLSFVSTGDSRHISSYPAFLSGVILQNSSRVYEGLSIFGPKALSMNVGDKKGLNFVFGKPGKSDSNLEIDPSSGKRRLQYLPMCLVPVAIAAKQWNTMLGSGNLSLAQPRKGKKEFTAPANLSHKIADDPTFSDMYNQIKGIVNDNRKAREGESGGKRKGDALQGKVKKAKVSNLVEDSEI